MLPSKLAFVDIETTGLDASSEKIIEIGVLRVEENKLVQTFHSLINPEIPISSFSLKLTGITVKELENAPTFMQVLEEIFAILRDCVFVAHNVDFDYYFVKKAFQKHHKKLSLKRLCTVKLFRYLYPNTYSHNLDALIERFGFEIEKRHRAYDDAKVLWEFYARLKRIVPQEDFESAIEATLRLSTK